MGSYENIVKTEEIRRRAQEGDFDAAQKIIDTMILKKIKNIADLTLFAEIYIQNERYDEAMELLYRVYKKSRTRRILYQMVIASIGRKNIEEAESFLKEYEQAAPNDFSIYIFRYKINKAKKEPYIVLIDSLKKLKEYSYIEKWAYELAKLYYKAGMEKECIQECSDLILWFGEGSYVEKAKILKAYYSGEVDKDEIIKNLKNRASQNSITSDTNNDETEYPKDREALEDRDKIEDGENLEYREGAEDREDSEYREGIEDGESLAYWERREAKEGLEYRSGKEALEAREEIEDGEDTDGPEYDEREPYEYNIEVKEEDSILRELEENVGKEVDILLAKEQKDYPDITAEDSLMEEHNETGDRASEKEAGSSLYNFIRTGETNEDLDRLDELSESLGIDIYQMFGNFLHIKSIQKQLANSLELIMSKRTKSVQMIITGEPSSGKTTLAKDIAIFLNKTGKLKTSKIAKISAEKLNEINITAMREELRNSCLVIENASELKRPTIDKLLELIKYFRGEVAVIFEENKKNMNRLFRECPKLMELFKNRIHLPGYSREDILGFGYTKIFLREYELQQSARAAFEHGADKIIENTKKEKQLEEISKYAEKAMTSADLRTGKQLSRLVAEGKLADADVLSILPEDFN